MHRATWIAAGLWLVMGWAAAAESSTTARQEDALVRELEARYAASLHAARGGDLDAYWETRTAAARTRPPALDAPRLKLLADLLPPLETLQFVRLDSSPRSARLLYRWRKADAAQYSVLMYRLERGEWRLDEFAVKRTQPAARAPVASPAAAGESITAERLDSHAQDLLRAWESTTPDPTRRLNPPHL
jgi:hypothetical protein